MGIPHTTLVPQTVKAYWGCHAQRKSQGRLTFFGIDTTVCISANRFTRFLPARRYASAGLCDSDVSVRLSVRPSAARRYCA